MDYLGIAIIISFVSGMAIGVIIMVSISQNVLLTAARIKKSIMMLPVDARRNLLNWLRTECL